MIISEHITPYSDARERHRNDRYQWRSDGYTREGDRLLMFTTEGRAQEESLLNLEHFKNLGRAFGARYFVVNRTKLQFVTEHDTAPISDSITKDPWYKDYKKEHTHGGDFLVDRTDLGKVLHLRIYNHGLFLKEHHGVYDINEDVRVKNRESIIERFWEYGFATWRGRPPTVAQLRWSGPREHLEDLTGLAERYWKYDNGRNDVAKKIVSAYRSINRYAAWPGAW